MSDTPSSNRGLMIGIAAVTVLLFAGFTWLVVQAPSGQNGNSEPQDENVTFNDAESPRRGAYLDKDLKLTVHMYSDFQCPACRAQESVLNPIMQEYQDKGVRFIWKDFPLEQLHKNARSAANAARCADAQGWFWTYRQKMYEEQDTWSALSDPLPTFVELASASSIDPEKFKKDAFQTCVQSNAQDAKIAADISEGLANHIDRTPTYFIGKKRYFSMAPADFRAALEKELAAASPATSTQP